jgi:hypothetical protein
VSSKRAAHELLTGGALVGGEVMHPNDIIAAALASHQKGEEIAQRMVPPQDADVVAYITIRLHAPGTLSVQGHIADQRMALQLLDHAREAITRQVLDGGKVVVPSRDVEVTPSIQLREMGDMPPNQRGDG